MATASATVGAPDGTVSASPATAAATATAWADVRETSPAGIGLPGLCPASRGASTTSLTAPIDAWSSSIATPSRAAVAGSPPATSDTAPATRPSRAEGNGWIRRTTPAARAAGLGPGRSDVDELVEVRDEVLDQPCPAVGHLCPDPRDERVQRDGRDHQVTL